MRRIDTFFPAIGTADTVADVLRLLEEIDRGPWTLEPGECVPSVDVIETDAELRVIVDVPGVAADSIRVVLKNGLLIVAGLKQQPSRAGATTFHLIERSFGRFARGIPIGPAFDGARVQARLTGGELTISLPKIAERRGRRMPIQISTG